MAPGIRMLPEQCLSDAILLTESVALALFSGWVLLGGVLLATLPTSGALASFIYC